MDRLRRLNEKLFNRNVRHLDRSVRRPDEVERVRGPRHRSAPPTPTHGVGQPGPLRSAERRLLRFDLPVVPEETDYFVSSRTRSRTETARTIQEADPAERAVSERDPAERAVGERGLLSSTASFIARSSQLAIGFLQGVLSVLARLLTLLDPVVAALNRARYPRETIAFLLGSLLILLAAGLYHHNLAMKLAAEDRRHEHKMELKMLELLHTCPSTGTNVSNVLQTGPRQMRLERHVSSPEELCALVAKVPSLRFGVVNLSTLVSVSSFRGAQCLQRLC